MANIRITDKQTVTPTASDFILINQAGNDKNTTLARVKTLLNGSVALETVEQNTNAAINEVNTKATNASTDINSIKSTIGIGNLETTSQNLIGATNEINTRVGRETLETVAQNCTGGINELNKKIGNIDVENDGTVATQLNAFAYNCKVKTSANVAIAQDDNHIMSFGTVIKNEKNMFDTVGKTKINILKSGNYLILAEIIWDNSATGNRTATIRKNGSEYIGICKCYNAGADTLVQQVTALAYLEKGDYVEVVTVHNQTGGALSILCDSSLSIQKVGD